MKDFDLLNVKKLATRSLKEEVTGNDWLDSRYNEQVHYVGHTQPYYRTFYLIAQALKPDLVVELGSWQATGAAHFAAGHPGGQAVTVDIHREDLAAQDRTLEAVSRLPNLMYLNMWTWEAAKRIANFDVPIDILFIDSWHEYQYAVKDWEAYEPLLADVALVIVDDVLHSPPTIMHIDKFVEELPGERFIDDRIHPTVPMAFLKYVREKDEPVLVSNREADQPVKKAPARSRARKSAKRGIGQPA